MKRAPEGARRVHPPYLNKSNRRVSLDAPASNR